MRDTTHSTGMHVNELKKEEEAPSQRIVCATVCVCAFVGACTDRGAAKVPELCCIGLCTGARDRKTVEHNPTQSNMARMHGSKSQYQREGQWLMTWSVT